MAVPKSKVSKQRRNKRRSSVWKLDTPGVTTCPKSKQRRNKRRSSVWKLDTPSVTTCPKCGEFRLPHRMCKNCMSYNGHEFAAETK